MGNISDMIEQFILDTFDNNESSISRNELANYFDVSPSQINYVLATRFTYARGYNTESRRGGGGYVKIYKIADSNDYIKDIVNNLLETSLNYTDGLHIINMVAEKYDLTPREINIMKSAISSKSLKCPIDIENKLRAKVLKNILITIL